MMTSHRNRFAFALLASVLLGLAGCPDSTTQSVSIISPTDGSVFTAADDVSDAIAGVQIDVVVRATGVGEGTAVDLRVNGESVGALTWRGSDLTFAEVTLQPGENVLRAVAGSASAQITVTLEGTTPCPTLQFLRPTASARLAASDDADRNAANGFQYDVQLSTDAPDGTSVELLLAGASAGTAAAASGRVTFAAATLLSALPAPGGAQNVTLRAQTSAACASTITIQVLGPAVPCAEFHFVSPVDGDVFGLDDDENGDPSDGFQKTVSISTNAVAGTEVELRVDGGVVASTTVVSTVLRFPNVDFSDGAHVLRIQYAEDDACGAEIGITVETGAPTCDIVDPVGGYLNAADDTDAVTPGLQTDFDVASDAESGRPVRLIIDGVETGAPTASISGGHARFTDVALSEGAHTVRARCENAVGNVGFSSTFSYTVDTVIPTCAITAPPDGTWYNDGDDALAEVLGTQVRIDVQVTDAPTATTVAQCGFAPLDPEGIVTPGVTGAGAGYVTLTGPGNQICCAVADAAGNAGSARITLNLDTEAPQFQIRRPDEATTLILAVDDEGPSDTFCQYTVTVGCSNIGQPVTLSINGFDHSRTATCTASADPLGGTATWSALTIPQGSVTLRARGRSVGGLLGTSPEKTVTVDTQPPALTITYPTCGVVLTPADDNDAATPGIQFRVSVYTDTSPVTLNVTDAGGAPIGGSPYTRTVTPPVAAVFASVTIVPAGSTFGTAYLRASATDAYGQEGLSLPNPCTIEVRDVPRVTITAPANGAVLGPADDCDAGRPGFDLAVTVSTNITSGTVELFVAGSSAGTQAYTGSPVTFCVPAADGSNIPVRAEGTDARGTGSAEIRVTIDSLPPDTAVTDLDVTVANRRGGEIELAWTAPADAGGGAISSYRIRCATAATSPVTFDWDTATSYSFTGVAGAPGTRQTQRLTGFRIERSVACMVRPADVTGSLGPLGNTDEVRLEFLRHELLGPSAPLTQMGGDLEPCGDVNGDGRDDFIVGGRTGDTAFLVMGRAGGLPAAPDVQLAGPSGSSFGWSVAGIGDFNGDTLADVLIGAFGLNANRGGAYLYYGRTSWPAFLSSADADVTLVMDDPTTSSDDNAVMGAEVSAAGDYDGDGFMDALVSSYSWNAGQGAVLLLFGRSIPGGTTLAVPGDYTSGFAGDLWLLGTSANGQLGVGAAAAYRLNGDAYDDVVLGAPGGASGGKVVVSYGRARSLSTGLRTLSTFESEVTSPRAGAGIRFGSKVALADLGGEGALDLLVYLAQHPGTTGAYGGVLGYRNDGMGTFSAAAVLSVENDIVGNTNDFFGASIATGAFMRSTGLARLDADGLPELLFGSNAYGTEGGAGVFYWGSTFPTTIRVTEADMVIRSPTGDVTSRSAVAYVGDVTGDGFGDMAVSHTQASGGRGRVLVLY